MQGLFKRHKNVRLNILTVHWRFLEIVARGKSPSASTPSPKELFEKIAESRATEMKFDAALLKTARKSLGTPTTRRRLKSTMLPIGAIGVILFPLFRVAQDFIGLIDFLEFLLRRLFVLRGVGMELARKFPKGALDFFLSGGF